MRDRQAFTRDGLDATDAFVFGVGRCRRRCRGRYRHTLGGSTQAGFRIDQELAGRNDLLASLETSQD
ncbi:hypothetical protein Q5N78_19100, partial [Acinetobacter baumannii]|nr:hypothetical protein [Acinetobacter baumannii]